MSWLVSSLVGLMGFVKVVKMEIMTVGQKVEMKAEMMVGA